ncbi:hypothetical protein N8198_08305 [Gammaproteobacteria bacterium]|nr:hypothetical protein [Gammaproteobacteria bacterium]
MKSRSALLVTFCITLTTQCLFSTNAAAGGKEDFNDCRTSNEAFCERAGSCTIQGSAWYQYVIVKKSEKFSKQEWPGLCGMAHVSLVQGKCSPLNVKEDITAYLSASSNVYIPSTSDPLMCGG